MMVVVVFHKHTRIVRIAHVARTLVSRKILISRLCQLGIYFVEIVFVSILSDDGTFHA